MSDPCARNEVFETERPLILDGGLATALESRGQRLHPTLWSAGVFLENPHAVEQVHACFLDAGAEVLISASYQMSFEGLAAEGLNRDQAARAMVDTVTVARRASRRAGATALVAASIGPYGATRCDGSEYTGVYDIDQTRLVAFHESRLEVLRRAGADLLAVETIPSLDEVRALAGMLSSPDLRSWVSFCCRNGEHLADGTPIAEAAACICDLPGVIAVGINCTAPEHVAGLMDGIRRVTDLPIVVYPNSGERWDPVGRRWTGPSGPEPLAERAADWFSRGARAIGGCCRVGPETIRALSRMFRSGEARRPASPED